MVLLLELQVMLTKQGGRVQGGGPTPCWQHMQAQEYR
jgi:hypothetical protein